jgi:hypothetical protein
MKDEKKSSIKKNDLILFTSILFMVVAIFLFNMAFSQPGMKVKVISGHDVYGVYDLKKDGEITIFEDGRLNVIVISNGSAKMKDANCAGGDCLRQQAISKTGQSIACLPNKILIRVEGIGHSDVDSIAH